MLNVGHVIKRKILIEKLLRCILLLRKNYFYETQIYNKCLLSISKLVSYLQNLHDFKLVSPGYKYKLLKMKTRSQSR